MISRRAFLRAGAGVVALGAAGVGGLAAAGRLDDAEVAVRRRDQGCGPSTPAPAVKLGKIVTAEFASAVLRAPVRYAVAYPPGAAPGARTPLVLALYGRGGDYLGPLAQNVLALPHFVAANAAAGMRPFVVATVEAGPDCYWHDRAAGRVQTMIVEEYLPLLGRAGLRVDRFGLHGESMGGFGAISLAQRLGSGRVAAVAVDGPALFRRYADASAVAFDSADDFAAHDVFARVDRMAGVPVRIVCGSLDPFYNAARAFARRLVDPPAETAWRLACHRVGYWRTEMPAQVAFLAGHLPA